ncbi:putative cobalt transporter subunit (CbtB) [compost metagenome]
MSAITQHAAINTNSADAIPLSQVLPWAVFGGIMMLLSVYFVGVEEGAMSITSSNYVHEYVHDARHLLGFPCH